MKLSLKHHEAMVGSALDCIIVMTHEGTIAEFNPAAEETFGYKRSEVIGKPLADMVIPERLREEHWAGLTRYLATGESNIVGQRIEMPAVRKDGIEISVELTVVPLDSNPPTFAGFIRDLSERERMEGQVAEARGELSAVLGSAPVGITVQEPTGRVRYANQAAADLLSLDSPEALLTMPPQALVEMFDLFDENMDSFPWGALPGRQAMKGEHPEPLTVCWRHRGTNEERWSIVRAAPIKAADGTVRVVVNSFIDITQQVTAKHMAEVSERRRTAQYEVSRILLDADTIDAAAQPILEAIGQNLGWQAGAFWVLDRESESLTCRAVWEAEGFEAAEYRHLTSGVTLRRGEGYPGRVLESGELVWEESVRTTEGFARLEAAARYGLQGAVFIPLRSPEGCVGVVEMFSRERLPMDTVWAAVFSMLGAQVGQFIARRWAEDLVEALSAPVLPLMKRCLLLPIIGTLDNRRVRQLQDKLPGAVHAARAKVVVLDVTGAAGLDSAGAQALAHLAMIFQLLGCRTIMTGVSTHSSVQLAKLGVDLSRVITTVDLESGIAEASRLIDGMGRRPERPAGQDATSVN